ncbi:basement membrane-specific heparan sulfate proteoglycan core protein isoform X2 [Topomyia yanbarensis]|uniref:basement membrane-specific heparan sulfate proteoglycan core protein isoform X2 n=1 Tax=Topomyia yanbarensis TaxID=2498891 RepID=UPI00273AA822|nr:basement membrane-specific heparan sulfate proteoglycan core protein isoform X2 [Topomyia yanbarensis]
MGSETRILGGSLLVVALLSTFVIGIHSTKSQHHDADLVFDDISSLQPADGVNDEHKVQQGVSKRGATNNVEEDSLFDLEGLDNNVVVSDDDIDADDVDGFDDDDDNDDDIVDRTGLFAPKPELESQNWLLRNVHRIRRSIGNLLNDNDSPTKKPKRKKNLKKAHNGSKKMRNNDLNASNASVRKNKHNVEKKSEHPFKQTRVDGGRRKMRQQSQRLKRHYYALGDDEDAVSGSGGHPFGFEFEYAYKLTLTVFEAYNAELDDKESNRFKQVAKDVAEKLHALLSDLDLEATFIITVHKLERNPHDDRETFVTFEINADKSLSKNVIDNYLRAAIEQGYENFDMKGYSLTAEGALDEDYGDADYHDPSPDKPLDPFTEKPFVTEQSYTVSSVDRMNPVDSTAGFHGEDGEEEDDNGADIMPPMVAETEIPAETSTHIITYTEDKCRGDDKFRCGQTNVFICEVQKCDGQRDCPNGEDENPADCLNCTDDEFSCDQEKCIPKSKVCDNVRDCDDGSDEVECKSTVPPIQECDSDEFVCRDKSCIPLDHQCDGHKDCLQGEDELNCSESTQDRNCSSESAFQCNDGHCISSNNVCDGIKHCSDGEDEDCVTEDQCNGYQFRCLSDSKCIPLEKRCNRRLDCIDGSDEKGCARCDKDDFHCDNGYCIPRKQRCDRWHQCSDGSDEKDCDKSCTSNEFTCHSGDCIDKSYVCNGIQDCLDGSDEHNCSRQCSEFTCSDNSCVPKEKICDGFNDCMDGSDEFACDDNSHLKKSLDHNRAGANHHHGHSSQQLPAHSSRCGRDSFECHDGICIADYKKCNGIVDCHDQSDELDCPYANEDDDEHCTSDEFYCDGKCVDKSFLCDGRIDCQNGEDEDNCDISDECSDNEFTCDGICIAKESYCNGLPDCDDGTDENNCIICQAGAFHCKSRECIPPGSRCDGVMDCNDNSDEIDCNSNSSNSTSGSCNSDQWKCDNGLCINSEFRCDNHVDCSDRSDEVDCPRCTVDQFSCSDGSCIDGDRRCDNVLDCRDGSDERDCDYPTHTEKTDCPQHECTDGTCIEHSKRCDGVRDCRDGSDEINCRSCNDTEFACLDGYLCIDAALRCDSYYDCKDFSDEQNCFACYNEFECNDGQCIPKHLVCNRHPDCRDQSDERNCTCSRTEFRCNTGECIPDSRRCDLRVDCGDGSDEHGCKPKCREHEWTCTDGNCIHLRQRCDRRYDCTDGSDERNCHSDRCDRNMFRCENGPCIPQSFRCNGKVDCPYDTSDELDCIDYATPSEDNSRLNLRTYPDEQIIKEKQIIEGREVVFQCRDEGPVRAKVKWTRANGMPLPPGSRDFNGRLEIPNIRFDHNGDYVCEAVGYPKSTPGSSKLVHLIVERSWRIKYRKNRINVIQFGTVPHIGFEFFGLACSITQATCMNGDCIAKSQICDGNFDCIDGSDETGCRKSQRCEPNEFKCRNNKCILKTWRCDGESDCSDGSDEDNCAISPPGAACRYDEFQCRSEQCIPKSFQCDSHPDCFDKSDEIGCMVPSVIQPPPPSLTISSGGILNITCRATGVPIPLIVWRLNWNHVPEKCTSYSDNGFGILTCNDMQPIDAGAYSCEIINSMGTHFVSPDTIVVVTGNKTVCRSGYFNSKARHPEECINCFCFGVSNQCQSADLYTYALQPPVTSLTIVGVEGPWSGQRKITEGEFINHDLAVTRHGVQLRLANIVPGRQIPYYSLPEEYKGNQLKSYGGTIRYTVEYDGAGNTNNAPDLIIKGNNLILMYNNIGSFYPDERNAVSASFLPGVWRKEDNTMATREEIMMVLANVESLLIKILYVDGVERNIELLDIAMDSAANRDLGLGSATLVEECRCPPGYKGLSCENCDYGYVRQSSGPWLGRCVAKVQECRPGYYGDPNRGIQCQPCPCPVPGDKSRARTCYMDNYNNVICNCDRGYTGDRCQQCASGYIGNPMGDGCSPAPISNCNRDGTSQTLPDGKCICKAGVTGVYCDRCQAEHFFMHDKGCVECFCMGVSRSCTSTSMFRDTLQAAFNDGQSGFSLISDYTNPEIVATNLAASSREIVYRNFGTSDDTFYWRLPAKFLGNKLTSYGGFLNYTLRYTPHSSGGASRNNSPDVVLHSGNKIKLHHYRTDGNISPIGSSTYTVPILEDYWQNYEDGNKALRQYLLMALANVSDVFIKATYNTVSNEAALSQVSLDIASEHDYGSGTRAWPVEQCQCIQGHIGLSCEDCAPGYYKGDGGLYLGLCEKCECNEHSDECDPVTGVCLNCRHNTYGNNCEYCTPPYVGNATGGTAYDCSMEKPDTSFNCQHCDSRGSTGKCEERCECKRLVEGYRCDQCREGSFDLSSHNIDGCRECFCSGVTKSCSKLRYFREDLPIFITGDDDGFALTNRDGHVITSDGFDGAPQRNEISYNFRDRNTYYWSLPERLLGNQILSYGANLTVTQSTIGSEPNPDQDIILIGNGLKLFWSRPHYEDGVYSVPLLESYWTNLGSRGPYQASRSDLMTVLSKLDHILIRATVRDYTTRSSISDIVLGTAVNMRTDYGPADEVELCRCPPGYRGTSCEQCDELFYKDVFDRSAGIVGVCKPCPCDNAVSCGIDDRGDVICNCQPGYTGPNCDNRHSEGGPVTHPPPPPIIEVVVAAPTIQIVEVGRNIRLGCTARYIVSKRPIDVRWDRVGGRMPERAYTESGTLIITNVQISDSGTYVCQAGSGPDTAYQQVTVTVEGVSSSRKPEVTISTDVIDLDEYRSVDVNCVATGFPTPVITWERMDQHPLSTNVILEYGLLRFNSLRKSDEGTYRCSARNDIGEADKILHVYVRDSRPHPTQPPRPDHSYEIIKINPDNYQGRTGDQITLSCICQPSGQIKWAKAGEPNLPRNSYVQNELLIIEHSTIDNSGRYSCTAIFPSGRERTSFVDVVIAPIRPDLTTPRVKTLDNKHTITQGTDYTIICEATGNPHPTVKWTLSGKPFSPNVQQSGNTLRILNAQPDNGGVYICVAENSEGMDRSYTLVDIELLDENGREPPILELYPTEPQVIKVGESTRLSCRATGGVPYPTLIWVRRDRKPLSSRITQDYPGVITLREVILEDSGEYECRAENSAGSASLSASVDVQLAPIITISPPVDEHKLYEGDELSIQCTARGKPEPTVVIKPPHQDTDTRLLSHTEGLGAANIHIFQAEPKHSGTYECVATNLAGTDSRFITIQVEKKRGDLGPHDHDRDTYPRPPYIDRPQQHTYKAILGERSELVCNEASSGARTEWRRSDGRRLPYGSIPRDGHLIIENTGHDAAGLYDCVAHDIAASPTTIVQILLEVIEPPRITFSPTMPMVVRSGETVTIICNATGEKPIRVSWHGENGQSLPERIRVSGQYLQFTQITTDDAGRYYCSATNRQGNVTKVAEVIVNRNEMIPDIPAHGRIHEVYRGSSISLDCKLPDNHYFPGLTYHWSRLDRPLPYNIRVEDRVLQLNHIRDEDAGRYECRMTYPNGSVAYDFVDVAIKGSGSTRLINIECTYTDYVCKAPILIFHTCLPSWMICDGISDCADSSDERNCRILRKGIVRSNSPTETTRGQRQYQLPVAAVDSTLARSASKFFAPQSLPILRLEPTVSYLKPGESVEVDCTSSAGTHVPIVWERTGGQPLPYNFRQDGNRLIVQDVTELDSGKYTCVCRTDEGLEYISDFELNVNSARQPETLQKTAKVEYADRGSTVKLQCNTDIYPTSFQWSRDRGSFNADQNITIPILTLTDVQAADAGTYICTARHNGQTVDVLTTLVVNGAIPFFPQSPKSYMAFNKIDNAYSKFNFEISFKPEKFNGLILYNGQRRPNGDYISLSLRNGFPQFKFDFNGQLVSLQPEKPIAMGQWHTIKVNRVRNNGFLLVNDQSPVVFPDKLKFHGLNLDDNLYIGGVPNFASIPATAVETREGFVGCISRLVINGREIQLHQEAIANEGTTSCEPCADDPCKNSGVCLETQSDIGYSCVCQEGYTGKDCMVEGHKCMSGTCGIGRCEETAAGAECYCPIRKTGDRCQYTEHYADDTLAFKDGSYAAYDKFQTKRSVKYRFKPDTLENGVLLYAVENEKTYGDFIAVILNDGFIELRYSVAGKIPPVILRSTVPIQINRWHDLSAGRSRGGLAYLQVDEEPLLNEPKIGRATAIALKSSVFVGGYDKRVLLNRAVGVQKGFEGCIADLEISGNAINMIDDIKDSANIYNCGHQQSGENDNDEDNEIDPCKAGYGGSNCDIIIDICLAQKPCQNGGHCSTKQGGLYHTCECHSGFLGRNCEQVYATNIGSHFRGDGFLEVNPKAIVAGPDQFETKLAIMFSTNSHNGMLLWYGQRNGDNFAGDDYLSLSVHEGYLEIGMRLDGEESTLRNEDVFVADGEQHVAVLTREANRNRLEVDHFSAHGETRPTGKTEIHLPGNVYIGGAPDLSRFTGDRFNESFNGCVYVIENPDTARAVPLQNFAMRTVNVDVCDDPKWIIPFLLYPDLEDGTDVFGPLEFDKVEEPPPVHIIYPRPFNSAYPIFSINLWSVFLALSYSQATGAWL